MRYPPGTVEVADIIARSVEAQTDLQHEIDYREFAQLLCGRDSQASLHYVRRFEMGEFDLLLCVLNSCTITASHWTEYGYVGKSGIDAINQLSREPIDKPTYKFVALHHHLLPVTGVATPARDGVTLTLDAANVLASSQQAGVHVTLHGHQHKAALAIYQGISLNARDSGKPIHIVSNGSTSARSNRRSDGDRNTYGLIQLSKNGAALRLRELRSDGDSAGELYKGPLRLSPVRPGPSAKSKARRS